jgi:hypothetical protein
MVARASASDGVGEEGPAPKVPSLDDDPQLRAAHRALQERGVVTVGSPAIPGRTAGADKPNTVARRSE